MATGKRYYWIKLHESFMNSDMVDYMLGQKNGASYVVLYQMLCLKTINTRGRLAQTIGEITIPYDVDKIQRDCKWFSAGVIRSALKLYKQFGLIEEGNDGMMVLTHYENLVGSETDWTEKKRREKSGNPPKQTGETGGENFPRRFPTVSPKPGAPPVETSGEIFLTDIRDRDKEIEMRDQEINSGGGNPGEDGRRRPDFDTLEVYASSNLQHMSANNLDELVSFRDALPDALIRHGIDEACAAGHPNYGYVRSILNRYAGSRYKTVGDVKAAEAQRAKASGRPSANPALDYEQRAHREADYSGLFIDLSDPGGDKDP